MTSAPCCSPWKARHNPPYSRSASPQGRPPLNARVPGSEAVHPAHHRAAGRPEDGGPPLEQVVRVGLSMAAAMAAVLTATASGSPAAGRKDSMLLWPVPAK